MREVKDRLAGLAAMSPAQLRAQWQRLLRQPPPPISPDLLRREIAYRLQETASGGLTRQVSRQLADIRKRIVQGSSPLPASSIRLKPGTRLLKTWRGKTYTVLVGDAGFIFNDRLFPSLSPIAQEITGTPWSGPRFFGLLSKRVTKDWREADNG
jgi:hypothetical protein